MLKTGMYVRCSIDREHPDEPRDFALGQVININLFAEKARVRFCDVINIRRYYQIEETAEYPLFKIQHCKINLRAKVLYKGKFYRILDSEFNKSSGYYNYYLLSETNEICFVCENELKASFNECELSPLKQMKSYEFQNPAWYFGRSSVNSVMHLIDNAVYGFKELAGCKIFLKPYQLKTVMRCLAEKNCRYMIADEVGLGKTIEASAVLKVFLADKKNKNVLIIVPEALTEQWKTELAFKFRLFEGKNTNDNYIFVKPFGSIMSVCGNYDFIIVDEVHRLLNDPLKYNKVLKISKSAENVLMLSATPVQSRNEEYHRLLSLIQPDKYFAMTEGKFKHLLDLQTSVVRKVHSVTECFTDYKETIKDFEYEHVDDTEEIYEELIEVIEDIACTTNDVVIKKRY